MREREILGLTHLWVGTHTDTESLGQYRFPARKAWGVLVTVRGLGIAGRRSPAFEQR